VHPQLALAHQSLAERQRAQWFLRLPFSTVLGH